MFNYKGFSKEAGDVVLCAARHAAQLKHETVGTEHLLLAFASVQKTSVYEMLTSQGVTYEMLLTATRQQCPEGEKRVKLSHDDTTVRCKSVLERSVIFAQSQGKKLVSAADVGCALFSAKGSTAHAVLTQLRVDMTLLYDLLAGKSNPSTKVTLLHRYGEDMTHRALVKGYDPCIGRDKEMAMLLTVLCRRRKNNACLVGPAGVGKTALAEELALLIATGQVPPQLQGKTLMSVSPSSLVAGTKFRGDFEERLATIIADVTRNKNIILFVDELHSLLSAGGAEGAVDAANILKPALARGDLQLIGATTEDEYRNFVEKDSAFERRFARIAVNEPSQEDTLAILKGLLGRYEAFHGVKFNEEALITAIDSSVRYINGRYLPDKAIDILDEAAARQNILAKTDVITGEDIKKVIALKVGGENLSELSPLHDNRGLIGQQNALTNLYRAANRFMHGLGSEGRPTCLLCVGPSGVGKSTAALQLAKRYFSGGRHLFLDMSQYHEPNSATLLIGAPPGYVGYDRGGKLTEYVRTHPGTLVIFKNLHSAHIEVQQLILSAIDSGRLCDNNGRDIDFSSMLLLFTQNTAKTATLGFGESSAQDNKKNPHGELYTRMEDIITFEQLTEDSYADIARAKADVFVRRLARQGFICHVSDGIYSDIAHDLCHAKQGAKPIHRLLRTKVLHPLCDEFFASGAGEYRLSVDGVCARVESCITAETSAAEQPSHPAMQTPCPQ